MVVYIPSIFILILSSLILMYFGFNKEDFGMLFLSSTLMILGGFDIINQGFLDFSTSLSSWVGVVFIFIAIYVMARSGIELLQSSAGDSDG